MKLRHILFWIFIIIFLVMVIDAKSNPDSSYSSYKRYIDIQLGETKEFNNLEIYVSNSIGTNKNVINKYSGRAMSGYTTLGISIKNTGTSSKYIYASDFKLVDSLGREYDLQNDELMSSKDYYLYSSGKYTDIFGYEKLQPGITYYITLIFQVPPASESINYSLRVYR